jgi:hypothetical protein
VKINDTYGVDKIWTNHPIVPPITLSAG